MILNKFKAFFKLIRWFHELLAILPFLGLYFIINYYAQKNNLNCNLSGFHFLVLCFCVQLLIAAGCVLNDIMDSDIDKINKPKTHIVGNTISLKNTKIIFSLLTLLIIILSIYISLYLFIEWGFISFGVYLLSILYDVYLKKSPLLGNILMALLTSFIPLVIFFFAKDCIEALHNERINMLIYLYAIFPFLIIIPRELSLDISDIEGDKACGCRTLPILIGKKKSKLVVAGFLTVTIILSFFLMLKVHYLTICLSVIDVLLLYYIYKLRTTETRIGYIKIGRFLWFIMILGLIGFTIASIS
jgi:4-hydroxybenzoate polyprenyltransferase